MVRTRSQKARDTQWSQDAVLNNPDLLCHIAYQADLPTGCKLLTTSKRNFISCSDFFSNFYDCCSKNYDSYKDYYCILLEERDRLYDKCTRLLDDALSANIDDYPFSWGPYKILANEHDQVRDEEREGRGAAAE